jgi:hypothetical protein
MTLFGRKIVWKGSVVPSCMADDRLERENVMFVLYEAR